MQLHLGWTQVLESLPLGFQRESSQGKTKQKKKRFGAGLVNVLVHEGHRPVLH